MVLNPASWNRFASVLYIEAPVGVGYSVSQRDAGQPNDEKVRAQTRDLLTHTCRPSISLSLALKCEP